jgi:hypothetical protein
MLIDYFFFIDKRHMPGFINKAPKDQMIARFGQYKRELEQPVQQEGKQTITPKQTQGCLTTREHNSDSTKPRDDS